MNAYMQFTVNNRTRMGLPTYVYVLIDGSIVLLGHPTHKVRKDGKVRINGYVNRAAPFVSYGFIIKPKTPTT